MTLTQSIVGYVTSVTDDIDIRLIQHHTSCLPLTASHRRHAIPNSAPYRTTPIVTLSDVFFQAEDGIRYHCVPGVQMCALFFSSRRRHTRSLCDWSSDVCSSD